MTTTSTLEFFRECASKTDGIISVNEFEYCGMPMIVRKDGKQVLLSNFVMSLDEVNDVEQAMFSHGLSWSEVSSVFDFLRRITEFNILGVDITARGDHEIESDLAFQQKVRNAVNS